jgi:multicomponent Na+:H+ antiporter subunit B
MNTPSLILRTATRYLMPLLLIYSLFTLFRGHNAPGGGFVGGLLAASSFALYGIAFGVEAARRLLWLRPHNLIATGLAMALASGLVPFFFLQLPLMTAWWYESLTIPVIGKLGTPFFFDIGVYLTVIGVTVLILFTLQDEFTAEQA